MPNMQTFLGPHFFPMMQQWPPAPHPAFANGSQASSAPVSSSSVDQQSTVSEISSAGSDAVESGASSSASGNSSFSAGNYGM